MWVLVAYRMLLVSNSSTAPRSEASSCCRPRASRYSRRRSKSTRFSQSTPCSPGAGVVATGNSTSIIASREPSMTWQRSAPLYEPGPRTIPPLDMQVQPVVQATREWRVTVTLRDMEVGDIGARLREERERVGISQRELARRLGVSASLISQIESGQSKPSVGTLYAVVTELGVSLDHVFRVHELPSEVVDGAGGREGSAG